MAYKAAIFDLDGTLLNTLSGIEYCLNNTLKARGFPVRTTREVRDATGYGARHLIAESLPIGVAEIEIDSILKEYTETLTRESPGLTHPYNGVTDVLTLLNKSGIICGVLSNKPDSAVKELCTRFFPGLLKCAEGEVYGKPKKPEEAATLAVMAKLGANKQNSLLIGDSEVDVITAKNAGIACAGATWGFRDREILKKEGADYIINTPRELLEIIKIDG